MQVSPKLEFNWIISTEGEETDVSPKLEKKEYKEIICGVYGIWFQYDNSAALWKYIWSMPFVLMPMDYFIIILNMTLLFSWLENGLLLFWHYEQHDQVESHNSFIQVFVISKEWGASEQFPVFESRDHFVFLTHSISVPFLL